VPIQITQWGTNVVACGIARKKAYSPQGPMPPLVKLLWADEDAVMSWAIFKENMKARRAEDPTLDIYLKRTAEYAVRLATIRAVARAGGIAPGNVEIGRAALLALSP
jgi:hypothetical protein